MLNIFIFSNALTTKSLILSAEYLLNKEISNIYVLSENHRQSDFQETQFKVHVHNNIDFCVSNSDLIFIVPTANMPIAYIDYITKIADKKKKMCININNPWKDYNCFIPELNNSVSQYPIILLINVGPTAQGICTEIMLNQLFANQGITIHQQFSDSTLSLLNQLNTAGILNDQLENQVNNIFEHHNAEIVTLSIKKHDNDSLQKSIDLIRRLHPDFIILQSDYFYNIDNEKLILEANLSMNIDIIIKSNFIEYKDNQIYYPYNLNESVLCIETPNIKSYLADKIFSKLALPKGIVAL